MDGTWFMRLSSLLLRYPEIWLAIACFFIIPNFSRKNVSWVNWPIVGALPTLFLNLDRVFQWGTEVLLEHDGTFMIKGPWFTRLELLITSDPATVTHILSTNMWNFPKGPDFVEMFDIFGESLFTVDYEKWKMHRKLAIYHVTQKRFRQFVSENSRRISEKVLIPILEHMAQHDKVVDLQDVMERYAFDSTCILVFGIDPGCLSLDFPKVEFAEAIDEAEEAIFYRFTVPESWWKLQRWLRLGREKKYAEAWKTMDHIVCQYISTKREELRNSTRKTGEGEEEEAVNLLTSYIDNQVQDERSILISDKFLRNTMLAYLFAGRDTTSSALTWFFWIVSTNPTTEMKIIAELKTILPEKKVGLIKKKTVFNSEDLHGLVYLHAALRESLRLFPPTALGVRGVMKPDVLPGGQKVGPRTKIIYSAYAMARMESIWGKDCLEFKPERWISADGRLRYEPACKFLAFNAGPRTCLGKEVTFTQMKAVVAAVLYNFHIEVVEGHPVCPKASVLLQMKHGLKVKMRERWI